jgi:hypothetical protein
MKSIYQRLDLPDFSPVFGLENPTSTVLSWPIPGTPSFTANVPELHNGKYLCYARYNRHVLDSRYYAYVENLIPELAGHIVSIGLQTIFNAIGCADGVRMLPHTDGAARGRHCLHFIIEPGGENVTTTWYQEKNFPLVRQPRVPTDKLVTMHNLDKITDVTFIKNTWGIFRTDIIHDVKIIQTSRIAFTVGFSDDAIFETIVNKYGIQ